ncbi:hypothetical protein AGMMS4952_27830 [Spirochaetia bacterium]|nr:hypothetical protein AGMMS4952_27830 [Spirochaetia bacterium]
MGCDIETTEANIKKGLAEAMEKDADRIAHEEQHIRDSLQPLERIVSDEGQENLNSIGASQRASPLRHPKSIQMFREFHKRGLEPPVFFGRENEMPDDIRELFNALAGE